MDLFDESQMAAPAPAALIERSDAAPVTAVDDTANDTTVSIEIGFVLAPALAVAVLLLTTALSPASCSIGIVGEGHLKPYAIIIIFFGLAYVSISLDETGVFAAIAMWFVRKSGSSGPRLFASFVFLSSLLCVLSNNDIVILTLTPIIVYACQYVHTDPVPFLIGQFMAAHVWSALLFSGNPTNIIVAEANQINFAVYFSKCFFPTIAASVALVGVLYLVFHGAIPRTISPPDDFGAGIPVMRSHASALWGMCILAVTVGLMVVCSFTGAVPLWSICLAAALTALGKDLAVDFAAASNGTESSGTVRGVLTRMPWAVAPFLVFMFIIVEALTARGWTDLLGAALAAGIGSVTSAVYLVGLASTVACNLVNNQPMTILFTRALASKSFLANTEPREREAALFALALGSNYGANLTLIGALAGIMWSNILAGKGVVISYWSFARYGVLFTPPILFAACAGLSLQLSLGG